MSEAAHCGCVQLINQTPGRGQYSWRWQSILPVPKLLSSYEQDWVAFVPKCLSSSPSLKWSLNFWSNLAIVLWSYLSYCFFEVCLWNESHFTGLQSLWLCLCTLLKFSTDLSLCLGQLIIKSSCNEYWPHRMCGMCTEFLCWMSSTMAPQPVMPRISATPFASTGFWRQQSVQVGWESELAALP